jgi:hypothetical protein
VEEISVLEEQCAPGSGHYIDALLHVPGEERSGSTFQQLLAVLFHGIVEVEL